MDWVWNFEDVVVSSGGGWLFLIIVAALLIGLGIGWAAAKDHDRRRYQIP